MCVCLSERLRETERELVAKKMKKRRQAQNKAWAIKLNDICGLYSANGLVIALHRGDPGSILNLS